jgi:hypothetical protein
MRNDKQETPSVSKTQKITYVADENSYYQSQQEVTIISRTPKGAYDPNNDPNEFYGRGWYLIGLSRNGKEPPEYFWRANNDIVGYIIIGADIGDRGTISLHAWAKEEGMKLPCPNAKNPPTIGVFGEVRWEKIR